MHMVGRVGAATSECRHAEPGMTALVGDVISIGDADPDLADLLDDDETERAVGGVHQAPRPGSHRPAAPRHAVA